MLKSKFKQYIPKIIIVLVIIVSIVYLLLSINYLFPYYKIFKSDGYIIEPNDLPSYKDVFNSLFMVLQVVVTAIFSYYLYKTSDRQRAQGDEKLNIRNASYIYYELKFCLIFLIRSMIYNKGNKIKDKITKEKWKEFEDEFKGQVYYISDGQEVKKKFCEIAYLLEKRDKKKSNMKVYMTIVDLIELKSDTNLDNYYHIFIDDFKNIQPKDVDFEIFNEKYKAFILNDNLEIFSDSYKMFFQRLIELKESGL